MTGVPRGDRRSFESLDGTGREVAEVADRRSDESGFPFGHDFMLSGRTRWQLRPDRAVQSRAEHADAHRVLPRATRGVGALCAPVLPALGEHLRNLRSHRRRTPVRTRPPPTAPIFPMNMNSPSSVSEDQRRDRNDLRDRLPLPSGAAAIVRPCPDAIDSRPTRPELQPMIVAIVPCGNKLKLDREMSAAEISSLSAIGSRRMPSLVDLVNFRDEITVKEVSHRGDKKDRKAYIVVTAHRIRQQDNHQDRHHEDLRREPVEFGRIHDFRGFTFPAAVAAARKMGADGSDAGLSQKR